MLRSILGTIVKDEVRVETKGYKINAIDIGWIVEKLKLNYAGHLVREQDPSPMVSIKNNNNNFTILSPVGTTKSCFYIINTDASW